MNKINKTKLINIIAVTLVMLGAFTLSMIITIKQVDAASGYYGGTGIDNTYQTQAFPFSNPSPRINSISPNSSNLGVGTKAVTITGEGFITTSIARVNGSNRPTTYVDSTHLMTQVTGNDMYNYASNGGFYITVFNGTPGGGSSNGSFFTIRKPVASGSTNTNSVNSNNNVNDTSTNFIDAPGQTGNEVENTNTDENNGLSANALFGMGIYPSGIIQWIFFAILVLLIVILVRKIYGADKRYHAIPLKHD